MTKLPHVSVSQIKAYDESKGGCKRAWFFDKIHKVPRTPKLHFLVGTRWHEVVERSKEGKEPFPDGWDEGLPPEQSEDILEIYAHAKGYKSNEFPEQNYLDPIDPERSAIEWGGWDNMMQFSEGLPPLVYFIDVAHFDVGSVEDHKIMSSWRYQLKGKKLEEDPQLLTYVRAVALEMLKRGQELPKEFEVVHNTALKNTGKKTNAAEVAKGERFRRSRATVTMDQVNANWDRLQGVTEDMVETAKCESYQDIPLPPKFGESGSPCWNYGGCDHAPVCNMVKSLEQHIADQQAIVDREANVDMDINDLLNNNPSKTAPKAVDEVAKEADVTNSVKPWANPDCDMCSGSGCRVCKANIDATKWVLDESGNVVAKHPAQPNGSVPPGAQDAPNEEPAKPVTKEDLPPEGRERTKVKGEKKPRRKRRTKKEMEAARAAEAETKGTAYEYGSGFRMDLPEEERKQPVGRPKGRTKKFHLAINCHLVNGSKSKQLRLYDFLYYGDLGAAIATGFGKPSYVECDVFKRRDAAKALIETNEEIRQALGGHIIVASDGNLEERELLPAVVKAVTSVGGDIYRA